MIWTCGAACCHDGLRGERREDIRGPGSGPRR
nr:MAG TPA: hypothetical protein [Caudoviricetes sp.]DAX92548.1 MAG TPA: hypothetical protein [Caudoviricetes sp.]